MWIRLLRIFATTALASLVMSSTTAASVRRDQNAPTSFVGLECTSSSHCVAVGNGIAVTNDGGFEWSTHRNHNRNEFSAISCPSSSHCVAVGLGDIIGLTNDAGRSWVLERLVSSSDGTLLSVSCPTVAYCVTAGPAGGVGISTDGGTHWSLAKTSSISISPSLRKTCDHCDPTSVWCWSEKKCALFLSPSNSERVGVRLISNDGGLSWTGRPASSSARFGLSTIRNVVCTSDTHCLAINYSQETVGWILYSSDAGLRWRETMIEQSPGYGIASLSCWTGTSCVATGSSLENGHGRYAVYWSHDAGATWKRGVLPQAVRELVDAQTFYAEKLNAVSCISGGFCLAVARNTGLVVSSHNGGKTWKLVKNLGRST